MTTNAVEVEGLTRKFGEFTAVDGVTFTVRKGEIFGFLGPNGAGKSTTIKMLCGLLEPSGGNARVEGFDIRRETGAIKRNIGYMSQRFSLYDDLTVEENIRFFGGVYGLREAKVQRRIGWIEEMAGLSGRLNSVTRTLSGGWKQRLALGCALIHEPPLVFLDEPTSGVDPISRRRFWELINTLSEQGTTVLVTTHYLDEAEYCNNIVLIDAGRIAAQGSPKELKAQNISYQILEIQTDDAVAAMEALRGEPWVRELSLFGIYLHVGVDDASEGARLIEKRLGARGLAIHRADTITPSLEDVFLHVLKKNDGDPHVA